MSTNARAMISVIGSVIGLVGLVMIGGSWLDGQTSTGGIVATIIGAMWLYGLGKHTAGEQKAMRDAYEQELKKINKERGLGTDTTGVKKAVQDAYEQEMKNTNTKR
jgi:hypothetical protein